MNLINKTIEVRTGPKTGVETRYYKRHEWEKLSREEQREVRDHRQNQLKRKKATGSSDGGASKIAALESMVEQHKQTIASLKSCKEEDVTLPPKPIGTPLKPPAGFAQRK